MDLNTDETDELHEILKAGARSSIVANDSALRATEAGFGRSATTDLYTTTQCNFSPHNAPTFRSSCRSGMRYNSILALA
jgi:hypothetical protein